MKMSRGRSPIHAVLIIAFLAAVPPPSIAATVDPTVDYPEERGADAGERWREKLGLSDEQVRKLSAWESEKAARLKPLRELLRNSMVQLQAQLAENAPENDIQDLLKQILQARRAVAERSERLDAVRASFLSPSQHARLIVWQSLGGLDGYAARRLDPSARLEPHEQETERE